MFTVAATVAAFGIVGVAAAQSSNSPDLTPTGVTVRLGASIPLDSSLTNLGNTLLDFGAEYTIPTPLIKGGETFLSVDYWGRNLNFGQGSVVPLFINQRWYTGSTETKRTYFFLGAGIDFIDVVSSNTALGLRGGFGEELGEHIIAEVAGYISDRAGGARANAVTFSIGYRF